MSKPWASEWKVTVPPSSIVPCVVVASYVPLAAGRPKVCGPRPEPAVTVGPVAGAVGKTRPAPRNGEVV